MNNAHILLLASCVAIAANPAYAATSHCKSSEQVVFSCNVGKKILSICASKQLSADSGYIQYRFGPKNHPELLQPDPAEAPSVAATAKTIAYSGGGGAYMRFNNGAYSYIVYSGTGQGWAQEGVVVEKRGKQIANLVCKQAASGELGPDFFEKFGIPEDEQEFEIPVLEE